MVKYIIFDFDGTLINTRPIWLKGFKEVFSYYGIYHKDSEIIEKCFGVRYGALNLGIKQENIDDFYRKLNKLVKEKLEKAPLFKGVKKVLNILLSKGFKLCICTSSKGALVKEYLSRNNLDKYFNYVVGFEDVKKLKPDPEGIYKIMEFYGDKDTDKYLMVGNSAKDILAGKNAGVKTALFLPNDHTNNSNKQNLLDLNTNIVFKSWEDLVNYFGEKYSN